MRTVAAMKIGSTSTSLLVAEDLSRVLLRRQRLVNLYAEAGATELDAVLQEFTEALNGTGCAVRLAAGGEAVRRQPHLAELVARRGWPFWEVSGAEEGRVTWLAVKAALPQTGWIVDVGGGSTEFASETQAYSVPAGAAHQGVVSWPARGEIQNPVIVGGTAQALSSILRTEHIAAQQVQDVLDNLTAHPEMLNVLDPLRRKIFPQGLRLIQELFSFYGWTQVTFSTRGFLEGLWLAASGGNRAVAP